MCTSVSGAAVRQLLGGQCQPDLSILAVFHWEQSSDVCSFRRQNPTLGHKLLTTQDGSFPQEGKLGTSVCERQSLGGQDHPDLSALVAFIWEQPSDVHSFRRQNPTSLHSHML